MTAEVSRPLTSMTEELREIMTETERIRSEYDRCFPNGDNEAFAAAMVRLCNVVAVLAGVVEELAK